MYKYSATSTFPTTSYNATNYWVDVNFATQAPSGGGGSAPASDTVPGESGTGHDGAGTAANPVTQTATTSSVENQVHPATVTFAQAIEPQTLHVAVTTTQAVEGSETAANTKIAGTVEYNPNTLTASFRPDQQLAPGTTYKAVATAQTTTGTALGADHLDVQGHRDSSGGQSRRDRQSGRHRHPAPGPVASVRPRTSGRTGRTPLPTDV